MEKIDFTILQGLVRSNHLYEYTESFKVKNNFSSIYPFATENIKGYLDIIDVKDKDVLTVGASGDQSLNLLVKDVKSVDYFDVNPFTQMYFNLKCAAINVLSIEEFLEFFCYEAFPHTFKMNMKAFSINAYHKISPYLEAPTRQFWDSLYLHQNGVAIRRSMLFSNDEEPFRVLPKINNYLSEDSFKKLKTLIKTKEEPRFIETDITKLSSKITKKYDYILLSNIAQYLDSIYIKDELLHFKRLILNLSNSLNVNGKIMVSYLYETTDNSTWQKNYAKIYDLKQVREIFKDENLELINFDAINDLKWKDQTDIKDAAFIYTKKN